MTSVETKCRLAYRNAMNIASIRRDLIQTGRAVFRDGSNDMDGLLPISDLYSITRIEHLASHNQIKTSIYVNGFEVASYVRKVKESEPKRVLEDA